MILRAFLASLAPGDDRALARTYAGRESASERAARLRRQRHRARGIREAAAAGQAWEDRDRRRG